jgi:hypothetical protein
MIAPANPSWSIRIRAWRTVGVAVTDAPAPSSAARMSIPISGSSSTTRIERPRSAGNSMNGTSARLSANARGGLDWWAAGSRAVDQSSARNKRNDRLAEGHERVAETVMMLRMPSTVRPGAERVTLYVGAPAPYRVDLQFSDGSKGPSTLRTSAGLMRSIILTARWFPTGWQSRMLFAGRKAKRNCGRYGRYRALDERARRRSFATSSETISCPLESPELSIRAGNAKVC